MNTGSALARFTITLSQAVTEPVQVEWFTSDGTAKAGVDYAANKGTALFAPGETSKTVDILVYGRAVGSEDRSFFVEMLPPTNAILGASIGECIITVDTSGSTPVTQIIVPTGPKGIQGDSAYQAYLNTTTDNPPMTEGEWVESLKGNPAEIALEVAPLIDVGATVLVAEGTEALSKPDSTTVKAIARRIAYAAPAKIATVVLADGDNSVGQADMTGDALDLSSSGISPKIMRGNTFISPTWSVTAEGKILIKGAIAGDVLYVCQYDFVSHKKINTNSRELWRRVTSEAGLSLVDGSFEEGAVINNKSDAVWHIAGGQSYTWGGTLPKIIDPDSAPDSIGWIKTPTQVTASNVILPKGGSVQDAIKYFTPEMFGAKAVFDPDVDDQPFVDKAIQAAESSGYPLIILQRQYNLVNAPYEFKTPGDDGTVPPQWVGNGDENLPPEDRPVQQFHLKILNGTRLIGLTRACGFTGGWSPLTSPIAIEQPGMLLVTRAPGSSYLGTLTNHIANFTPINFFIGIVFEGIVFQSLIEDIKPIGCGIAMIVHANENSLYHNLDFSGCYSGIIIGGWWNFRSRISGGNATTQYVPPYDGTGQNLMGWCDGADFYNIGFSVADRLWGDRHENFDTWYGRYFYKNGNSALTSAGGRASNNTDPGDTATYSPFYGITSRAITILSRNGRGNGNNNVRKLRTNGTHRAPIFVNRSNRCTLQDAHVERSGWVDANTRSQVFGVDVQDPRRPAGFLQCTLAEGFIPLVGDYDMSASVSTKPLIPGGWRTRRSSTALDGTSGLIGSSSYPQQIIWAQDGAPYEKILDRVRMQGNNAPDPANGNDLYIKTTDYYRIPALVLGNSANRFMHQQGTFTPVVKVGSTVIAPTGTPRGFYERIGDTIKCWINFYETGVDLSTLSGQVSIEGFPLPITSLENTTAFPIVLAAYIKTNASGLSGTMTGTTLSLRKNYSSGIFNGSDFLSGTEHFLQLQVEYTVTRVGA